MKLSRLGRQFKILARELGDCRDPKRRTALLIEMRAVIRDIDDLILTEYFGPQGRSVPTETFEQADKLA